MSWLSRWFHKIRISGRSGYSGYRNSAGNNFECFPGTNIPIPPLTSYKVKNYKATKDGPIEVVESKGHEEIRKKADRYNEGKMQWSLVDFKALEPMVQGLMYGAKKYSRDQWKLGLNMNEILDSLERHYTAILSGEMIDEESGVPHIGLLMCNALFYSHFYLKKINEDGVDIGTE